MTFLFSVIIAAMIGAPTVVPAPGSSATYRYVLSGRFWNGALVQVDRTESLTNTSGTVEVSRQETSADTITKSHGTVNADGTVSFADRNATSDPFAAYNSIALLVRGISSVQPGSQWTTSLAVQTGKTVTGMTQVPVTATVANVSGDEVTIQGTGTVHAVSTYDEYRDPIDLTIQVAARFLAGRLERADYKATEYVHAGPMSQAMTWSWSLSAES